MTTSTELQSLVNAARDLGEQCVVTQTLDGTVVEIHFHPRRTAMPAAYETAPERPGLIAALRLKNQPIIKHE